MRRLMYCAGAWLVVFSLVAAGPGLARGQTQSDGNSPPTAAGKPAAEKNAGKKSKKAVAKKQRAEEEKADAQKPAAEKSTTETPAEKEKPAAAEKAKEKESTAPKPATHTAKRELFKVDVSEKGAFTAKKTAEIIIRPEEWKTFTVLEAVEHGSPVKKGDVLVRFDAEKLDEQIADHRAAHRVGELALKQAEESLKALEELTPLDLALTERIKRMNEEDFERFFEVDLPISRKSAEYSLKSYQQMLEYEEEELRQLEKMYNADDLTEETEEIILKRQRDAVDRARFYLETAKVRNEETIKVDLPRLEESIKDDKTRQEIAARAALASLPVALSRQRLEVEKLALAQVRSKDRLEDLVADRELMTVTAPIDGLVYYGKYVRGSWSGASNLAEGLRPGGRVAPDDVFMTVVQPKPIEVLVTVPESDLHWFSAGLEGIVEPTAYPDLKINSTVIDVESIPFTPGKYTVRLAVTLKPAVAVMPGMACTAKFVPYLDKKALTVPAKTVFTDEINPRKQYVYLVSKDGKQKKRRVEVGQKSGDKLEILDGLDEGDQILLERPKDE